MHKKLLGASSIVLATILTVSTVGASSLHAFAAEDEAVVSEVSEEKEVVESEELSKESTEEVTVDDSEKEVEADKSEDVTSDSEEKKDESTLEENKVVVPETEKDEEKSPEAESKAEDVEENNSSDERSTVEVKGEEGGKQDEKAVDTPVEKKEYEIREDAPTFYFRWGSDTTKGRITFDSQYKEYIYDLGEEIPSTQLKSIKLKIRDQENTVCFKLHDSKTITDGNAKVAEKYVGAGPDEVVFTNDFEGSVRYIGIMSCAPKDDGVYPYGITIDEIIVDKEEAEPNEYEKVLTYEGEALKFTEFKSGDEVEGRTLEFDEAWREYRLALGQTIKGEDVKSVKYTFAEKNSQSISFKAYGNNKELDAVYGKNGSKSYVYYPNVSEDVDMVSVMAMNEQTYPFNCTVEKIEITVDTTPEELRPKAEVEYDIVDLRDAVAQIIGNEDFIIGTAASYDEFKDEKDMALAFKHFNGVTLGNELKPDSMLKADAKLVEMQLGNEMVLFPELSFTTPESRLDLFVDWNNEHPEKQIKIRGHVLVWHSQTPEFFFHEDYDTSKPYVTPEVMNKRLEIYIREVAEHFTAEDSKYRDLFYGWDVVNEAISDSTNSYRSGSDNPSSSWWKVYESPEFIANAFVYANKYMPSDIALFYNDYNDTVSGKVKGICELLKMVKSTPGARIDGMGMQAHYQIDASNPSAAQIKEAAKKYAEIVDQVQITELDFKGATSASDPRLAQRYLDVFNTIRRLRNEGVNFTGMTIWGVTDKHSWLQSQNSVGGAADGKTKQYPLLFDDYYKAKECFYAIANAGELEPEILNVHLVQKLGNDFDAGEAYKFGNGETEATFVPMWRDNQIEVALSVVDPIEDDNDSIAVYVDDGDYIHFSEINRSAAEETDNGYIGEVAFDVDENALLSNKVKIDVVITNGEEKIAFCDTTFNQSNDSKYFATTLVKPLFSVHKGTVEVDGDTSDEAWKTAQKFDLTIGSNVKASASAKLLWDEENLYVLTTVKDPVLNKDNSNAWEQDSVEYFIDENNAKKSSYEDDDKQYRVNFENEQSFNGKKCNEDNIQSEAVLTKDGYVIEAAFKWTDIAPEIGTKVGFDIQLNDADSTGARIGTLNWADNSGQGYASTEGLGTIILSEEGPIIDPGQEEPLPDPEDPEPEVPTPDDPEPASPEPENPGTEDPAPVSPTPSATVEPSQSQQTPAQPREQAMEAGTTDQTTVAVEKKDNTLKVSGKTVKATSGKKVTFKVSKVLKVSKAVGKVSYKKVSGNKKITINSKTGKVTVKKGLKKGTYKVKVNVKAAGNEEYKDGEKTVTFKVKVK